MTFAEIQTILKNKVVGIAGCGGLGSNCAVALARIGIGKLIIADFDIISLSNLNRQFYFANQVGQKKVFMLKENIYMVNPQVEVEAHEYKLGREDIIRLYKNCDVLVEAFDLAGMKQMIIETVLSDMPHVPLVAGLGMAGWGDNNSIHMQAYENIYICGDFKSEIAANLPPLAPRVGIVASMQANQVLELLIKNHPRDENNTK